ncbi:MAG TPA: 3-phosphoglycerate dehydrogenase [Candidatus Aphodovivens excrementavium]|nr:3-phosphoglycerate dehydrogenase [Candidatus Aphodovivens excrementavium]
MTYAIHCMNNISDKGIALLSSDYRLTDDFSQADGILVRSASLHDAEFPEGLRAIARAGAGVNNIPLDRCADEGIVVFNTPGANANAVKELVIAGMMMGARDIAGGIQWCRDNADDPAIGKAAEKAKKAFAGTEILGKKLGVIGLGAIGALVANAAVDLGMDVYGYDPFVSVDAAWRVSSAVHHVTNLDDIFASCDYITIHVPATPDTVGMVGAQAIAQMKGDVVALNFSRDTLVDEAAMAAGLESGKVRRYVTDFATPGVMAMKGAVVLPHLGASTAEAEENCAVMAVRELMDYLENGNIANSVNYPACNMGPRPAEGARIAVLHANVPNMISQISGALAATGANIANLTNKARGEHAYTLIDVDGAVADDALAALRAIEDVRRVRAIG